MFRLGWSSFSPFEQVPAIFLLPDNKSGYLSRPPTNNFFSEVHAQGDQTYTCKSDAAKFTWTRKAPDAQLFDKDGKPFGKHFAGPFWEANDGKGALSSATTIQRINTKGGKAPASDCDASHAGQQIRVSYSVDYLFYAPK